MSQTVLSENGISTTKNIGEWHELAIKYGLSPCEIGLIDLNRTGVVLDEGEVRIGFRTRFNGSILYGGDLSWYALPVRNAADSMFHIHNGKIFFQNYQIGYTDNPILDTCNTSYQRGKYLLNLNSRSRSNCAGCKACVHNDKSLYDDTVIKDRHELKTHTDIKKFFEKQEHLGVQIDKLDQIAVVTGLFIDEDDAISHLEDIYSVATDFGFSGELMYFGCQIMSANALQRFSKLGKTAIVFAIDNFTERHAKLSPLKSAIALDDFYASMSMAKAFGITTTFAYIVGVDDLDAVQLYFQYFEKVTTRFPVVNIFQVQTALQAQAMHADAKNLEYYIKARKIIENIFHDSYLRPRRWENYRPLWYRTFADEDLEVNSYGENKALH